MPVARSDRHFDDLRLDPGRALDVGGRKAPGDGAAFRVGAVVEVRIAATRDVVKRRHGGVTLAGRNRLGKCGLNDLVGALEGGGARKEGLAA